MRSAWSPTRSMSFDTVFEVWPNCLLALPTVLATDFTSMLALPIERGSFTPRIFLRLGRPLSIKPPAIPTAAAPTATAGPLALLAALLSVATTPLLLCLALLRLELVPPPELDLLLVCGLRFEEPLLAREALLRLRVEADDFERDEPPDERDERGDPLRDAALPERADPLAFVFEPAPFDALLLLCPLREADLLVAIP